MDIKEFEEVLTALLDDYDFNPTLLASYLSVSEDTLEEMSSGTYEPKSLAKGTALLDKLYFLLYSASDDKDRKLQSFLEVLVLRQQLSAETIAAMADVDEEDVRAMLGGQSNQVDIETKYRIAVTVMALRFFLKECE